MRAIIPTPWSSIKSSRPATGRMPFPAGASAAVAVLLREVAQSALGAAEDDQHSGEFSADQGEAGGHQNMVERGQDDADGAGGREAGEGEDAGGCEVGAELLRAVGGVKGGADGAVTSRCSCAVRGRGRGGRGCAGQWTAFQSGSRLVPVTVVVRRGGRITLRRLRGRGGGGAPSQAAGHGECPESSGRQLSSLQGYSGSLDGLCSGWCAALPQSYASAQRRRVREDPLGFPDPPPAAPAALRGHCSDGPWWPRIVR